MSKLINNYKLNKGENVLNLDKIYPIKPLELDVLYYINEFEQEEFFGVFYANKLVIEAEEELEIKLEMGNGYIASKLESFENRFIPEDIWSGGDGIFSFNLENGLDQFDLDKQYRTLFVFGDTFVGNYDKETQKRLQPHLMPNNSLAYLDKDDISFHVNRGDLGEIKAFYDMDEDLDYSGSLPINLVRYDRKEETFGYLSGYNPKDLELVFDFYKPRLIEEIKIFNYFSKESNALAKRGVKELVLLGSFDNESWVLIDNLTLDMAKNEESYNIFKVDKEFKYLKFKILSNYNDSDFSEGLFGLAKVEFFNKGILYRDILVSSNSILTRGRDNSWIWLQDGVVIGDQLYFLPLVINSDLSQPEGLQFAVKGVSIFKTPIENGKILPEKRTQKMAPLLLETGDCQYLYGAAIMSNTKNSGAKDPDGYIYIYGYKTTMGLRELIVARVKEDNFEYFDDWEFYDGLSFGKDILKSAPLLQHISCEMSVSKLNEGPYKDKYLAVFTYDVNTPYVAFALGETPYGPFSKPQTIFHTPEQARFKSTTYTYNAKAHPHLSSSKEVLVSYNTNTYNFEHNMSSRLIYRPRFIVLKATE